MHVVVHVIAQAPKRVEHPLIQFWCETRGWTSRRVGSCIHKMAVISARKASPENERRSATGGKVNSRLSENCDWGLWTFIARLASIVNNSYNTVALI